MKAQTLSFHLLGLDEDQANTHCDMYAFALPELPGLISQRWMRCSSSRRFIATLTWASNSALQAFRHSELYARLALDPHVSRLSDEDGQLIEEYARGPRRGEALCFAAA